MRLHALGFSAPAGVDEAGRGCICGPVFAAAVVLAESTNLDRMNLEGIRDSKLIPEQERQQLAARLRAECRAWAVASASVAEIEDLNILQASRLAMKRAVEALVPQPDFLLVDFLTIDSPLPQQGLTRGDAISKSIAAASILAKVARDEFMIAQDGLYPGYGLASHKGYGTPRHLAALKRYGPTPLHRRCFAPVRQIILGFS
jgi:ribonuclease HII